MALGDLLMTDQLGTQAECSQVAGATTVTTNPGADSWPLNNFIVPATAGTGVLGGAAADPGFNFGVVISLGTKGTGADNTQVELCMQGRCKATIFAQLTTPSWGKALYPNLVTTVKTLTATGVAGAKCIARLEQDAVAALALGDVLFDGIDGFGQQAAS